jgi:O-antigen/teichoic acid export membrane protein
MIKPVYLLTSPLTGVMVSGLSQSQGDPAAHTAVAARFFRFIGIGLFPCAAGLAVVGPDVMTVLGSDHWRDAGLVLSALAPALLVQGFFSLASFVLSAAGKSGRLLALTIFMCLLVALGGWAGIRFGELYLRAESGDPAVAGALGLAIGYSAVMLALWGLPLTGLCLRIVGIRPAAVLWPLAPALVAAVLMGLAVWGLSVIPQIQALSPAWRLGVLVAAGVVLYAALAFRELRWAWLELVVPEPRSPNP